MEAGAGAGEKPPDLSDASNVLLSAPVGGSQTRALFLDAFTGSSPAESHVLVVTYTGQPTEWVDGWNEHVGQQPASGAVLTVGQPDIEFENDTWSASAVENPGDLTGTGIEFSELLSELSDCADPDEQISVGFDSVTSLLQYADMQRAFRFLHVVTGRVRNADARCYYHLNPTAHDQQTIATLTGLFDATIEREDDGWSTER